MPLLSVALAGGLPAQQFTRIQNRFRADQFLHTERGPVESGRIEGGWWSADWIIEPVAGEPFVRLRNRFRGDHYIHVEHGQVSSGPLGDPGWHSAQWTLDRSAAPYVRFRNRWRSEIYLHTERGRLEAGPIDMGWWSAQWTLAVSPNSAPPMHAVPPPPPPRPPASGGSLPVVDADPCPSGCADPSDGLRWRTVPAGQLPADAYVVGNEPADGATRPLTFCRVSYRPAGQRWNNSIVGKTGRGIRGCNVAWEGREVEVNANVYEVLVGPLPAAFTHYSEPVWLPASGGNPAGGRMMQGLGESGGCRAFFQGGIHPGVLRPGRGCGLTYGGSEVIVHQYEVFTRRVTGGS